MSQLAQSWCAQGHTVTVVTFTKAESARDFYALPTGVKRIHLGAELSLKFAPKLVMKLRRVIRDTAPDHILSFSDASNALTWLASTLQRQGCSLSIRNSPEVSIAKLNIAWRVLIGLAYRRCRTLIVQTEAAATWVRSTFGREALVIRNALRPMPKCDSLKETTVLAIGSLIPRKGHDVLLRAFSQVSRTYPDWRLIILGEGPCRQSLTELSKALELGDKVDFPGQVRHVEHWLAKAPIFAMTSWNEGYPNALIEAMAMGLASVSTRCPDGPDEIIEDGVNGILVPIGDVDAVAHALRRLIESTDLTNQLGREARSIRRKLDPVAIMEQWNLAVFR